MWELVAYNTDSRYPDDVRWREYTRNKKLAEMFRKIPKIQFSDSGHGIVFCVRECTNRSGKPVHILREYVTEQLALIEAREKCPAMVKRETELADRVAQLEAWREHVILALGLKWGDDVFLCIQELQRQRPGF